MPINTELIRDAKRKYNRTLSSVAAKLGIKYSYVHNILRLRQEYLSPDKIDILYKIADELGIPRTEINPDYKEGNQ